MSRSIKVVCGGLALWSVFHPYQGIWHDARLYTVAALHWLSPEAYGRDIWFAFGSQDDLTLFSPLYAAAIRALGVSEAARTMVVVGAIGWVAAVWALYREILSSRLAIAACLASCMLPLWYSLSGTDVFQVSESFVTARIMAVPLSLFGLAAVQRGRIPLGFVLLLAAAAMHPIMASGPIAVAICLCCNDRFQFYLLTGVLLALVVAMLNPMRWTALEPIDGVWMELVRGSGASALLQFQGFNFARVFGSLGLLLWGATLGSPAAARIYRTVTLVVAWSLCAAEVVCFFYPSALLVQMQLWRSTWLAVVLAIPAGFEIAATAWQRGKAARLLLLLGGLAVVSGDMWASVPLAAWLIYAALSPAARFRLRNPGRIAQRSLTAIAAILFLLMLPTLCFDLVGVGINAPGPALSGNGRYLLRAIGFYILLPAMVWWVLCWNTARYKLPGVALSVALLVAAFTSWDQRPDSKKMIEASYRVGGNRNMFGGKVHPGETVYWPANTVRVWLELGTASYAGREQAIGVVFSQQRTLELWRRMQLLQHRSDKKDISLRGNRLNLHRYDNIMPLTTAGLYNLCADPALDYVIDPSRIEGYFAAQHSDHLSGRLQTFYLYDCDKLGVIGGR